MSKTGRLNGTYIFLKCKIGPEISYFGCRHHILSEIVLVAVLPEA